MRQETNGIRHIARVLALAGLLATCQVCGHEHVSLGDARPCVASVVRQADTDTPDWAELEAAWREAIDKSGERREDIERANETLERAVYRAGSDYHIATAVK